MVTPAQGGPINSGSLGGPNRNGKWSNLLPRMSTTDVQTLQQEITTLHSEINASLPPGHESNSRFQHLLEKAQTILENDPTRSAESRILSATGAHNFFNVCNRRFIGLLSIGIVC